MRFDIFAGRVAQQAGIHQRVEARPGFQVALSEMECRHHDPPAPAERSAIKSDGSLGKP